MWPLEDDKPEWVKARDKRARVFKDYIQNEVPNIRYDDTPICDTKPFKVIFSELREMPNMTILCCIKYFLEIDEYGIGDVYPHPAIGYRKVEIEPSKTIYKYDCDHPYIRSDFCPFFMSESELISMQSDIDKRICEFLAYARNYIENLHETRKRSVVIKRKESEISIKTTEDIVHKWQCNEFKQR